MLLFCFWYSWKLLSSGFSSFCLRSCNSVTAVTNLILKTQFNSLNAAYHSGWLFISSEFRKGARIYPGELLDGIWQCTRIYSKFIPFDILKLLVYLFMEELCSCCWSGRDRKAQKGCMWCVDWYFSVTIWIFNTIRLFTNDCPLSNVTLCLVSYSYNLSVKANSNLLHCKDWKTILNCVLSYSI